MKAVVYEKYGPPEFLTIKEVEKPLPKDNEVLVKLFAAAVNSADWHLRKADPFLARFINGLTRPKKWQILGSTFAGEIEAAGKDVKMFRAGDQVFGSTGMNLGAHAEYVSVPEDGILAMKPAEMTYEEAAAVPFGALASIHFLKRAKIQNNQKVLVYGASGALGTAAVQIAKSYGAEVTGICSTSNTEMVKSLGADKVIDYTSEDFTNNGETYDVIFDTVGKSPFPGSVKSLNKNGFYLRAVHMSMRPIVRGMWTSLTSHKKVIGGVAKELPEDLLYLKELIEKGRFIPVVDRQYAMEQIAEAHDYEEKGHKKGNVVITLQQGGES